LSGYFSRASRARSGGILIFVLAVLLALPTPVSPAVAENDSLYGNYLAGRFAVSQRDNAAAAEFYRDAMRKDPTDPSILERAFVLELATANMEGAERLAAQLVQLEPGHRLARLTLGVEDLRGRQYASARRHFSEDGGNGPIADLTQAMMTAWSHQGAGDLAAALASLKTLDSAEWMGIYRVFNSALVADLSGDMKTAGEFYAEAYRLDNSVLRVAESYARFLARTGKPEEALTVLDAYEKVSEDHPHITAVRADIAAGRVPDPIVKNTAGGAAESLYEIGALLAREGGEDHAVVYLQLALYLNPRATMAILTLADVYERQQNHALAAEAYSLTPETSPLYRSAQIQRAHNLNALDRLEDAQAILNGLIEKKPDDIGAMRALGDILRGREQFEEAAAFYTKAITALGAVTEADWALFYYRGICFERTKRWDQAEVDFKRALELKPDQPFVLNYLGYSWIDQGQNLDQAMDMIRKAVELRPDDGYIVDSLGWAYYRLGDYESATRELERAVELRPEDPVINDHLGDAYWHAGRKLEARFQWSHARDLEPEPDDLVKIEEKLKAGLPDESTDRSAAGTGQKNGG